MQFKKIAFFIISISLLFWGCDSKNQEKKEIVKKVETKFTLPTSTGTNITIETKDNLIKIEEIKDKIILLNFWATWCVPCTAEIPHLISLQKEYKENFEIIGINMGDNNNTIQTNEEINQFIKQHGINYTIANSLENFKFAEIIGNIKSIPTMFMINKSGEIIQKYIGIVPEEMMEMDIKNAIGKM